MLGRARAKLAPGLNSKGCRVVPVPSASWSVAAAASASGTELALPACWSRPLLTALQAQLRQVHLPHPSPVPSS